MNIKYFIKDRESHPSNKLYQNNNHNNYFNNSENEITHIPRINQNNKMLFSNMKNMPDFENLEPSNNYIRSGKNNENIKLLDVNISENEVAHSQKYKLKQPQQSNHFENLVENNDSIQ